MIVHDCEQGTPEWMECRRGIPTASEFNRIVTPKKWGFAAGAEGYAIELIAQQYDYDYAKPTEYATAAMRNGAIIEPQCRAFYEMERNVDVARVGFVTTDDGRFGCSPDGLIDEDGGLELKHPTAATHIKWLLAGGVPAEHLAQCYGGIIVTRRKWWDFLSWYPGLPPLLVRVEPDERCLALVNALEKFHAMFTELKAKIQGGRDEVVKAAIAERGGVLQDSYF